MIISFISINSSYETQETCPAVNHTFRAEITIVDGRQGGGIIFGVCHNCFENVSGFLGIYENVFGFLGIYIT